MYPPLCVLVLQEVKVEVNLPGIKRVDDAVYDVASVTVFFTTLGMRLELAGGVA